MSATLNLPSTVIVGAGASDELATQLARLNVARVLLVTDPGVVALGIAARLAAALEQAGIGCAIFDRVQPDPTVQNVDDGLAAFRASQAEALVAVGGGSSIDAAKAISILTSNAAPLAQYEGYHRVTRGGAPLVAIPTTAGTGSEVTKVTVITDTERDRKMMLLDAHLVPRVALVDYRLTMSMPAALTAAVGVDTLTHGIEALVSRKASGLTDPIALSCVRLVGAHLRTAWNHPADEQAREGMMLAACQGGMAFANSSVCLVHGMSRPLGAVFHLPHGLSNAVLLPAVTRFSLAAAPERYATAARAFGCAGAEHSDAQAGAALVAELERLNRDLQIPRLGECLGDRQPKFEASLAKMASDALASGSPQNNPRVPTAEEIIALYREAY